MLVDKLLNYVIYSGKKYSVYFLFAGSATLHSIWQVPVMPSVVQPLTNAMFKCALQRIVKLVDDFSRISKMAAPACVAEAATFSIMQSVCVRVCSYVKWLGPKCMQCKSKQCAQWRIHWILSNGDQRSPIFCPHSAYVGASRPVNLPIAIIQHMCIDCMGFHPNNIRFMQSRTFLFPFLKSMEHVCM